MQRRCIRTCPIRLLFNLGRRGILKLQKAGEQSQIGRSYRKGIYKGLSKIISKMGICTIASYRGAQLFEIVGLDPDVVALCFPDTPARIGGVSLMQLHTEACELTARAWNDRIAPEVGGLLKYVHGGEYPHVQPGCGDDAATCDTPRVMRRTGTLLYGCCTHASTIGIA